MMEKVLTAMSGGVDSAVCCSLLQKQGFSVTGATMLLRCGAEGEVADARRAAEQMGLPFHVFDWRAAFEDRVQAPFRRAYQNGLTPNPCIVCNRYLKFGLFLEEALRLGYEKIATGHYAKIEWDAGANRYLLRMARDKDQTYMLYSLNQYQLAHTLLPLGDYTKAQIRALAEELGLSLAHKQDSQDICFVPDGDYAAYLERCGVRLTPGDYYDMDGKKLCPHRGAECYTIGQRRGLGYAAGERKYVVAKEGNRVILGDNKDLFSSCVFVTDINYIAVEKLDAPCKVRAKLRYTPKLSDCLLVPSETGAKLLFDEPQRAVTPGQAAVFYIDDYVLGGGTIV